MKITDIKYEKLDQELVIPIKTALGTLSKHSTLITKIETYEGIFGYGEAAPVEFVTGETIDTAVSVIKLLRPLLIGQDPSEIQKINYLMDRRIKNNTSAKAGIDIALHDIYAKKMGVPLYKALGGWSNTFKTDRTVMISSAEYMVNEAVELYGQGFDILKLKIGMDLEKDIKVIEKIRIELGDRVKIRIDVNQGWNIATGNRVVKHLENLNVEFIEQPFSVDHTDSMKYLREKTSIPVMADESCFSPEDAFRLVKNDMVDFLNIKLMKSGGIYNATKINIISEMAGVECMVGCMLESKVGIFAAAQFIAANRNITMADIDSVFLMKDDGIKGDFEISSSIISLPDTPGIGIKYIF